MGKRQIAAQQTRQRILAAAEKLIRERGFERIGVSDIAREAGVAKGSFYTYFRHKEDIVCEIAQTRFLTVEAAARAQQDVCTRIASFLTQSMRYIVETGLNICQQWLKNVVEPEEEQGKQKLRYDTEVIRGLIADAAACDELRADTPSEALAACIAAEYYGAVALWAITDGDSDPVVILENFGSHALRAILEPYRNERSSE